MVTRVVLLLAVFSMCTRAADEPKITVSGSGSIKVLPVALEVIVQLKEKGDGAAAALKALKIARDRAVEKLTALGAATDQVRDDLASIVDTSQDDARRRMMARSGGRLKRTKEEEKPLLEMQQYVRVRVPLKSKDAAALLIEGEELKAKVLAAKVGDAKAAEGETQAEEEDENVNQGYYNGRQQSGPVTFHYYAPESEEASSQAIADALKKARDAATRAAKAMGKTGVELNSIALSNGSEQQWAGYDDYGRPIRSAAPDGGLTSTTPEISVMASLSATFILK